jgi:hypothetical protein
LRAVVERKRTYLFLAGAREVRYVVLLELLGSTPPLPSDYRFMGAGHAGAKGG